MNFSFLRIYIQLNLNQPEQQQLRLFHIHARLRNQLLTESEWEREMSENKKRKNSHETVALILHFLLTSLYASCASGNGTLSIFHFACMSGLFVIFLFTLLACPTIKFSRDFFIIWFTQRATERAHCLRLWFALRASKELLLFLMSSRCNFLIF